MRATVVRPLVQTGLARPEGAVQLAGGWSWFTHAEVLRGPDTGGVVAASALEPELLARLTAPRAPVAGIAMDRPSIMGVVNVTPDSFSDGGLNAAPDTALASARDMVAEGVDIVDIGGESTRPGAVTVADDDEAARIVPVIAGLRAHAGVAISVDTRKAAVARAALDAGADLVNDVSGFTHDPALAPLCAARGVPVCVMHARGTPETMQIDPRYDDVILDVHDALEERLRALVAAGIPRARIIVDPGIGFGKTEAHNLALLRGLSAFHGLGCAILLGVSRKGFIGRIGGAPDARARFPGSIALGLAALGQGVQMLRVHDVAETRQALHLWSAVHL